MPKKKTKKRKPKRKPSPDPNQLAAHLVRITITESEK